MTSLATNARETDRLQDRILYALWVLFWVLMTVVELQDNWFNAGLRWWEPFLWMASAAGVATVWFALERRFDRTIRFDPAHPRTWFIAHLKWLPAVAVTVIAGMYGIRHAAYGALGMHYEHPSWPFVVLYESIKLSLFFGLWLGIFFAFNSFRALQGERQRLLIMEKSVSEARLAHLQSQLHPHFFFNVLNTISALMHVDVQRADRLVARMGDFLRATLRSDQQLWPLADELRILRLYADIMLERFEDRVELTWNVAQDAERALVPVLLLQPLMENAFRHSVEVSSERVPILVHAANNGDELSLEIRNLGVFAPRSHGVGLRNVRERLNVIYGSDAHFSIAQDGTDVQALIRMPLKRT